MYGKSEWPPMDQVRPASRRARYPLPLNCCCVNARSLVPEGKLTIALSLAYRWLIVALPLPHRCLNLHQPSSSLCPVSVQSRSSLRPVPVQLGPVGTGRIGEVDERSGGSRQDAAARLGQPGSLSPTSSPPSTPCHRPVSHSRTRQAVK